MSGPKHAHIFSSLIASGASPSASSKVATPGTPVASRRWICWGMTVHVSLV